VIKRGIFAFMVLLSVTNAAQAALVFNFSQGGGITAPILAGFNAAAQRWSNVFTDDITVNVSIDFTNLGSGVLGSTTLVESDYFYSSVRPAMVNDATTGYDTQSVANLPSGTAFDMYLNHVSNGPFGTDLVTPFVDDDGDGNNQLIQMTNANAKALGLLGAQSLGTDGTVQIGDQVTWDFDPSDGIEVDAFDFVGVVQHELGHVLGFNSGVDILDAFGGPPGAGPFLDHQHTEVSTLDLHRYSTESAALGVIDFTADARDKFFSVDGGATPIASFATGEIFGDGDMAGHWQDGSGTGLFIPNPAMGQLLSLSALDVAALDVIGFDAIPEPSSFALLAVGLVTMTVYRRRRRASSTEG